MQTRSEVPTAAEFSAAMRRSRSLGDSSPLGSPPLWSNRAAWASPGNDGTTPVVARRWPSSSIGQSIAAGVGASSPLSSSNSLATEGIRWALARRSCSSYSLRQAPGGDEGDVLVAVQRQIEALEERLAHQISRAQRMGNNQVDSGLRQLDARLTASEGTQPKLGRRVAELSGQLKGLVEEIQSQVLRFDSLDSKMCNWRRDLDEELQQNVSKLEKQLESSLAEVWQFDLDARLGVWRQGLEEDLQKRFAKLQQEKPAVEELHEEFQEKFAELRQLRDELQELSRRELQLQEQGARLDQQESCSKSLNGHIKGLLEEMQSQVLRTDALDARLSVFRRELAEEIQQKLLSLQQRFDSERACEKGSSLAPLQNTGGCVSGDGLYAAVRENGCDQRFAEASNNLESLREEVAQNEIQLQGHGLRLETALSRLEAQEICYRKLSSERVDWDSRFEHMHQILRDEDRRCAEMLTSLSRRVDGLEQEVVKLGTRFGDLARLANKVDGQERELANLGTHVGDLHERLHDSTKQYVTLRDRMDSSAVQLEDFAERLECLAAQKPLHLARQCLPGPHGLKAASAESPSPSAASAAHAIVEDTPLEQNVETMARPQVKELLVELHDAVDEILPKVAEHDRSTRVLLCDVLPRLGELSDARDEVRRNVVAMGERLSAIEAERRCLQTGANGHVVALPAGSAARQVIYAGNISPPVRRLNMESEVCVSADFRPVQ